ncbi:hypothetical protein TSMEX_005554 [Taenia solium]
MVPRLQPFSSDKTALTNRLQPYEEKQNSASFTCTPSTSSAYCFCWRLYQPPFWLMVSSQSPPTNTNCTGSTIHSIIDSTLEDAPEYLIANAERTQVQSVKSLVRSCPFLFYETLLDGKVVHTLSTCINVTGLMMTTQIQFARLHYNLCVMANVKQCATVPPLQLRLQLFELASTGY